MFLCNRDSRNARSPLFYDVEGEAGDIMDLVFENDVIFFYFHADAKRLAIVLIGYLSLRPSSFQDRVHILGGCFHTGFYLTALICCPMVLTNIYHS